MVFTNMKTDQSLWRPQVAIIFCTIMETGLSSWRSYAERMNVEALQTLDRMFPKKIQRALLEMNILLSEKQA